jgi:NAD(P)-dependent dehydrogenase (short-subunit alcohol dehydrogenase family)
MAYTGLNAVVTGGAGSSGIGRNLVELLLTEGANVFIGDVLVSEGEAYVKEANARYGDGRVAFKKLDVSSWPDTYAFYRAVETHFADKGGLDLCFPNAGFAKPGFPDIPVSASVAPDTAMIDVNVRDVITSPLLRS